MPQGQEGWTFPRPIVTVRPATSLSAAPNVASPNVVPPGRGGVACRL